MATIEQLVREAHRLDNAIRRAGGATYGLARDDVMPRRARLAEMKERTDRRLRRRMRALPLHPAPLLPAELAGRDLDTAIAEHVAGYRREIVGPDAGGEHGGGVVLVPPTIGGDWYTTLPLKGAVHPGWYARQWSEDLDEALWLLDQRFPATRFDVTLTRLGSGAWCCEIIDGKPNGRPLRSLPQVGATLALAIARTVLASAFLTRVPRA